MSCSPFSKASVSPSLCHLRSVLILKFSEPHLETGNPTCAVERLGKNWWDSMNLELKSSYMEEHADEARGESCD